MADELALTIPALRRTRAQNDAHVARMAPRLQTLARDFELHMLRYGWPIGFVQSRRTDAEQLAIWRHGRKLTEQGWVIVDEKEIQTRAQTVEDTAHGCLCGSGDPKHPGCAFAFDWAFLRDGQLVGPRPGPGNDSWDRELPWKDGAQIGERIGLWSGARIGESSPGALDGWDAGHLQIPEWRRLRAAHVVAYRKSRPAT